MQISSIRYTPGSTTKQTVWPKKCNNWELIESDELGSALSKFLFVLVYDVISEGIRNEELCELLHAEVLVIAAENEEELQSRVIEWQATLEKRGLTVNVDKTKAMVSSKEGRDMLAIHESRGAVTKQIEPFRYLGSFVNHEGGCEAEVENRIKATWGK
ncbi:uncharacterized protein [Palaemon carinicauda]|uniref:uncharacterized protein n=1 Tax=Palaemon carinicauda TaxID=392227 RepID=UPI0035B57A78